MLCYGMSQVADNCGVLAGTLAASRHLLFHLMAALL
jgi:hypothetical protein